MTLKLTQSKSDVKVSIVTKARLNGSRCFEKDTREREQSLLQAQHFDNNGLMSSIGEWQVVEVTLASCPHLSVAFWLILYMHLYFSFVFFACQNHHWCSVSQKFQLCNKPTADNVNYIENMSPLKPKLPFTLRWIIHSPSHLVAKSKLQ